MDYETSDKSRYPTFARTRPPDTQISKSVVSVLVNFQWTQVSSSPARNMYRRLSLYACSLSTLSTALFPCHGEYLSPVCGHGRSCRACPVSCAQFAWVATPFRPSHVLPHHAQRSLSAFTICTATLRNECNKSKKGKAIPVPGRESP
jgi:hypothetical protein